MADKLTIKQEKFTQGLFAGLSQREAYKQAFSCKRMSDNAIDVEASILANTPKIALRRQELTDELKERNMVTVERILEEFGKVGFANITDYLKVDDYKYTVGYEIDEEGNLDKTKPIKNTVREVEIFRTSDIPKDKIGAIAEIKRTKDGISLKLHDKVKALEDMGRHLGMFNDKLELSGQIGIKKLEDFF